MATRKYLSAREKKEMLARQENRCAECGEPFTVEDPPDFDHHRALINGGRGKPDRAIHRIRCHRPKSAREHKDNAKVKRIREKRRPRKKTQASKPKPNPWAKKFRRKVDGTVVLRDGPARMA